MVARRGHTATAGLSSRPWWEAGAGCLQQGTSQGWVAAAEGLRAQDGLGKGSRAASWPGLRGCPGGLRAIPAEPPAPREVTGEGPVLQEGPSTPPGLLTLAHALPP